MWGGRCGLLGQEPQPQLGTYHRPLWPRPILPCRGHYLAWAWARLALTAQARGSSVSVWWGATSPHTCQCLAGMRPVWVWVAQHAAGRH